MTKPLVTIETPPMPGMLPGDPLSIEDLSSVVTVATGREKRP